MSVLLGFCKGKHLRYSQTFQHCLIQVVYRIYKPTVQQSTTYWGAVKECRLKLPLYVSNLKNMVSELGYLNISSLTATQTAPNRNVGRSRRSKLSFDGLGAPCSEAPKRHRVSLLHAKMQLSQRLQSTLFVLRCRPSFKFIYIYTHTFTYMYTYVHALYIYIYVSVYVHLYIHTRLCMFVILSLFTDMHCKTRWFSRPWCRYLWLLWCLDKWRLVKHYPGLIFWRLGPYHDFGAHVCSIV